MRYKYKKKKKIISISIDEDVYYESGECIENLSRYLNQCLKNAIEAHKRKKMKEESSKEEDKGLHIMQVMTTNYEMHEDKKTPKYLKHIFKGQIPSKYKKFECIDVFNCDWWLDDKKERIAFIKSNFSTIDQAIVYIEKEIAKELEIIIKQTEGTTPCI